MSNSGRSYLKAPWHTKITDLHRFWVFPLGGTAMGWLGKVQFHPSITHSSSSPTRSTNTFTHRQPNSQMHFLIFQFSSSETFTGQICWAGCIRNLFTYRNTENTSTLIIGFVAWPRSAHYLAKRESRHLHAMSLRRSTVGRTGGSQFCKKKMTSSVRA